MPVTDPAVPTTALASRPASATGRPPLNAFGMAFGLSGLAGAWSAATTSLSAPGAVADALWAVAAVAWAVTIVVYAVRARSRATVAADLRHPTLGPFAALPPIVLALLGAHAAADHGTWPVAVVAAAVTLSSVFGAWFVTRLLTDARGLAAVHGGYLLPTVAASLIAAQAMGAVGAIAVGHAFFAVGILFWVLTGALLLARLVAGPPLAPALLPTLAIFSAPPVVAGNAWWALHGPDHPVVHEALAGTVVALLLPHAFLAVRYVRLPFSLGLWALTFTAGSAAAYGVRLLSRDQAPTATVVAWLLVAGATALVLSIAVPTVRYLWGVVRTLGRQPAS